MKTVAVFGGSGMTGHCVVEEGLKLGLNLKLLLRDKSTLATEFHDKVQIVQGNVLDTGIVNEALSGVDGVVVALGTRNDLKPTTEMSDGLKNIIAGMKENGIKNISVCLSAFLFYAPDKVPPVFKDLNADHQRMLDVLESSELDYVAVLPPHIADKPRGEFIVKENEVPASRTVSKRDLGAFLIESLSQPEHFHKRMGISSK